MNEDALAWLKGYHDAIDLKPCQPPYNDDQMNQRYKNGWNSGNTDVALEDQSKEEKLKYKKK